MLARFFAGRFASNGSPFRERRELHFAKDPRKPDDPGNAERAGERPEDRKNPAEKLTEQRESIGTKITSLVGVDIPRELLRSELLYRTVLTSDPAILSGIERASLLRLAKAENTKKRLEADVEEVAKNPDVLVACIRSLESRISDYERSVDYLAKIERADKYLFGLIEKDFETRTDLYHVKEFAMQSGSHKRLIDLLNQENARAGKKLLEPDPAKREQDTEQLLSNVYSSFHQKKTIAGWVQRDLELEGKAISEDDAEAKAVVVMKDLCRSLKQTLDAYLNRQLGIDQRGASIKKLQKAVKDSTGEELKDETLDAFCEIADAFSRIGNEEENSDKQRAASAEMAQYSAHLPEFERLAELCSREGINLPELCLKVKEERDGLESFTGQRFTQPDFLEYAQGALDKLRATQAESDENLAEKQKGEYEIAKKWGEKTLERVQKLASKYPAEVEEMLPVIRGCQEDPSQFYKERREMIDQRLLFMEVPRLQRIIDRENTEVQKMVDAIPVAERTATRINEIVGSTRNRLGNVFEPLEARLQHPTLQSLGVTGKFKEIFHEARIQLQPFEGQEELSIDDALFNVLRASRTASRMEKCLERLKNLPTKNDPFRGVVFEDTYEQGKQGHFHEGMIHMPSSYKPLGAPDTDDYRKKADAAWPHIEHELGHAMMDILMKDEETSLMAPTMLLMFENLRDLEFGDGSTFEELFEQLKDISIGEGAGALRPYQEIIDYANLETEKKKKWPEDVIREELMEELFLRYTTWRGASSEDERRNFHDIEKRIFMLFANGDVPFIQAAPHADEIPALGNVEDPLPEDTGDQDFPSGNEDDKLERAGLRRYSTGHDHEHDDGDESAAEGAGGEAEAHGGGFNVREELDSSAEQIAKAKRFIAARAGKYPKEFIDILAEATNNAEEWHTHLDRAFRTKEGYGDRPEEDDDFKKKVRKLSDHTGAMQSWMQKVKVQELDTTGAPAQPKGFMDVVRFWSIADVIKFAKDSWEDWNSIYKRTQDRRIKEVGEVITGAMRNMKIPGNFLWLNKYVQGLQAYHKRRYSGTEQEAANKWKEGMENEDSHELLHFLHVTRNKDAVRGIISLLCHRGEMDWNDEGVWHTFNALSRYKMPIEECRDDDVLRDTWIRKLTTDIWQDRELYYHWRTENDGKIKSGKSGFTDTADQLSNLSGGLSGELEKQLKMKRAVGPHGMPPQDVKPHLYEEVLEYAIRNGKMSMEDKFYYLIMGVRYGILGIERLRALAGEKGGVLLRFPFIDFFYQKNNSIQEMERFADEIQEDDPDHFCKPGLKTTLFLYYKVARSESARARISKATSRVAETIDHEDIPFLITQIDYKALDNLAAVISGARQKVTPEGWKNAYVGFNTNLKVFGELASLDDKKLERFTKGDARNVIQTITSYLFMDNILTRNGVDKDDSTSRPEITADQFEMTCPSGAGRETGLYRKRMNHFIQAMFSNRYLGRFMNNDSVIASGVDDGQKGTRDVKLKEFAPVSEPDAHRRESNRDTKVQYSVFKATGQFSQKLKDLISGNEDAFRVFKEFIRDYNQNFRGNALFNEGGDGDQFTREQVERVMRMRKSLETGHGHVNAAGAAGGH